MATSAPEGIMSLPENSGMDQGPRISLEESADAINQGLMNASPQASAAVKQAVASMLPMFDALTDEQLDMFIQLIQYLYDNPDQYQAALKELEAQEGFEKGLLPEEHDPQLLATMIYAALEAKRSRGGSMPEQAPMMEPPVGMAMGGIAEAARMVASKGRGRDTVLAHITPEEARLLQSRGGMGTINPYTGLPEYGFFKDLWEGVKKAFNGVVKVAKDIVKSPVGKILTTVALTTVLGPAGLNLGLSTAAAAGVASAGTTLLAGGNLKDALISGATGYFGAPGGPVSEFVGGALNISNQALASAVTSGIVGTGASLLSGKSLEDSVKQGLTQGVIGGATAVAGRMAQGKTLTEAMQEQRAIERAPVDVLEGKGAAVPSDVAKTATEGVVTPEQVRQQMAATRSLGAPTVDPSYGVLDPTQLAELDPEGALAEAGRAYLYDPLSVSNQKFAGFTQAKAPLAPLGSPTPAQTRSLAAVDSRGIGALTQPPPPAVTPYEPSTFTGQMGKAGSALMEGEFGQAYDAAKEAFFPSSASNAQIAQVRSAAEAKAAAQLAPQYRGTPDGLSYIQKAGENAVSKMVTEPGMLRTYGPLVGAGVAATGLFGGFTPTPSAPPGLVERDEQGNVITGQDLIEQEPSKYLVQKIPGITYDIKGGITGGESPGLRYGIGDIQRPTARYGQQYAYTPYQRIAPQPLQYSPYQRQPYYTPFPVRQAAEGSPPQGERAAGIGSLMGGGYPRRNGEISGPGTGTSDDIPAMLSDGEFVMTAKAVRGMGNGSRRDGAKRMYALMHQLERNAGRG